MQKSILFVINNFNIGGPQKSLLSLLYKIDCKKYNIKLMVLSGEGSLIKYLPQYVKVIPVDSKVNYATLSPKGFIKKSIAMILKSYKLPIRAVVPVLKGLMKKDMVRRKQEYWIKIKNELPVHDEEFDIAIGVSGGTSMMYVSDCVRANRKISWIRSDYRVLKRNNEIDRKYFKKMDNIISVSHICRDIFLDIFPETQSKVQVMYNVLPFKMYRSVQVDTSVIKKENGLYNLLTICRLDPNKGLDLALGALELLLKNDINIKWYILGGGSYETEIQNLIKDKGLEEHFILLGFQFNTAKFIEETDILVHPSRFEGKSNVIDEAKYLLKPIVATNYETVGEQILDGSNGLVSEMDSGSIANSILRIINNKNLVKRFRDNLKEERFNDQESMEIFYNIIESNKL